MLKLNKFLEDITLTNAAKVEELVVPDDAELELVIKDYDGNLHHIVPEDYHYAYRDGYLILELHSEIDENE